jgi:hypothetical protein
MRRALVPINATKPSRPMAYWMLFSPACDVPRHYCLKNGGGMWPQYGARDQRTLFAASPAAGPGPMLHSGRRRQKLPVSAIHRAHFLLEGVDNRGRQRLYLFSWRAAAWRASAKPLTVCAVNHPAMPYGHVGCAGFGGFPACRGGGRKASGCLKSESEERETWTAESLRAASSNGEGFGLVREGLRPSKRLRRSTFQVNTMIVTVSNHRNVQSGTSSKAM